MADKKKVATKKPVAAAKKGTAKETPAVVKKGSKTPAAKKTAGKK